MQLIKNYMAEEKFLYKCLLELCDYCNAHGFKIKRLEDTENEKNFKIELSKGLYIDLSIEIVKNEHIRPKPLIVVTMEPFATGSKVTKKIASGVRTAGAVVGGGLGAVASFLTPGVGWVLGTGVTYATSKIGAIPGSVINKVDDFLIANKLEKFQDYLKSIMSIFGSRMIDIPDFDNEEANVFLNHYIKENRKSIFHLTHKKNELDFSYNSSVAGKKTTVFYSSADDSELVTELKNSVVKQAKITQDQEIAQEFFWEICSKFVGVTYEEAIQKKGNDDIIMTQEELVQELRNSFIKRQPK